MTCDLARLLRDAQQKGNASIFVRGQDQHGDNFSKSVLALLVYNSYSEEKLFYGMFYIRLNDVRI